MKIGNANTKKNQASAWFFFYYEQFDTAACKCPPDTCRGIKTVLDIFQFSPNETVYFGDDQDDIEPIQMCGLGVAVANGIDDVKRVADFIADSNDADGVAKFIEARLLFSENI